MKGGVYRMLTLDVICLEKVAYKNAFFKGRSVIIL